METYYLSKREINLSATERTSKFKMHLNESLILAQDERWRRA